MTHLTSLSTWGVIFCLAGAGYCAWALLTMWLDHVALEREARDPADHSPRPFDAVVTDQLDEYADAARVEDADGWGPLTPGEKHVINALRLVHPDRLFDTDGCLLSDHERSVHSSWHLPMQRDGRA